MISPGHPLVTQFVDLDDPRQKATMLLSMPDSVILDAAVAIAFECQLCGLREAAILVNLRLAALHVVRSPEGFLPDWLARDLDLYRAALVRYAAGPSGHSNAPARDPPAQRSDLKL